MHATCLLFVTTLFLASSVHAQDGARLPHIVVILADDMGLGDIAAHGHGDAIATPHLDRLVREGMTFDDAHSPSAVCTPTRYGLLTGRYAWRTRLKSGVLWGSSTNLIDVDRVTLPDALRSAGYRTACVGKWHLGLGDGDKTNWDEPLVPGPRQHGFDAFFGIPASLDMAPYVFVLNEHLVEEINDTVDVSGHRRQGGGGFWRGGARASDFRHVEVLPRCEERAVEWVERHAREHSDEPFFLYMPLSAPHTPWVPTNEFAGTSTVGHYGDFVAQVDGVVGSVLAALDANGMGDDTLFIFTSDNGSHWPEADIERWGHDANAGLRGQKADVWEGGHRVPFVVRWPGRVPGGATSTGLLCLTDVMATCASIVGVELPDDAAEDGVDQSSVWLGTAEDTVRTDIVHHSLNGMFAIRRGPWKLVEGRGSGGFTGRTEGAAGEAGDDAPAGQLYDLASDPSERVDLYAERPDIVAELTELLDQQRTSGRSVR